VIGDVLDFSKMEAGQLVLDSIPFDLRAAVRDATQMLSEQAHAKSLEINQWVAVDVPETVKGDPARLRQILLNLLSNAVKFTATGEVTVRVTRDSGDRLLFCVEDTGIGINETQATDLFEAFAQADQATTRQYGGTGLGLAIARRLVKLMAGEIGAKPREGGGSVFWFTAAMPTVAGAAPECQAPPDLQARRTLVVDDNEINRTILEYQLRGWGLACESVDRPTAALAALEQASREGHPFELAVLDFNLPQMDGAELAYEIRKRPQLRALRLVILSSATVDARLAVIGAPPTLTKPAHAAELHEAVLAAFSNASPSPQRAPATKRSSLEYDLSVLLADDNEVNITVAEGLLNAMGLRTTVAHDGREAVQLAGLNDYDAIFMDCQMPYLDGYDAHDRSEGPRKTATSRSSQ
jgi:CheY-like chemotaxis protein